MAINIFYLQIYDENTLWSIIYYRDIFRFIKIINKYINKLIRDLYNSKTSIPINVSRSQTSYLNVYG